MRFLIAAALVLGLAGCADIDLFGDSAETQQPATADRPPAPASVQQSAEAPPPALQGDNGAASPQPSAAESEPPAVSAARAAPAPTAAVDAHCKNLAKLRARDSAFEGEDPETQEAVYNGTYRDCIAWDAAHRS